MDKEKVAKAIELLDDFFNEYRAVYDISPHEAWEIIKDTLKEQEKKEIKLHKKHVITWKRDDEFTMRKLYEAVCETLIDEGELVIVRIDDHKKVDFTFYVTHENT